MKRADKIISFVVLLTGIIGLIGEWPDLKTPVVGKEAWAIMAALSTLIVPLLGVFSGIFMLRRQAWAYRCATLFYLLQLLHIESHGVVYAFRCGFDLDFSVGGSERALEINVIALVMLVLVNRFYYALKAEDVKLALTADGSAASRS